MRAFRHSEHRTFLAACAGRLPQRSGQWNRSVRAEELIAEAPVLPSSVRRSAAIAAAPGIAGETSLAVRYRPVAVGRDSLRGLVPGRRMREGKQGDFMPSPTAVRFSSKGFTLIEMMVVVAIIAILAAIALPAYSDYVKRSKIIQATTALSDGRTRMEQYFLDNRTYVGGCAPMLTIAQATATAFVLTCTNEAVATYTITATGAPAKGMDALFVYTVDQANAKTSAGPSGWAGNAACWATRKDGSC
jgi:type IV pilus assembly protein PilE